MQDAMDAVTAFHQKMGLHVGDPRKSDIIVDGDLRIDLISEEYSELLCALGGYKAVPNPEYKGDATPNEPEQELVNFDSPEEQRIAVADALGDLAYVVAGAAVTWGIPLGEVFQEIHRSNMTKSRANVRADGKILKGPEYDPPDLKKAWQEACAFEDFMDADVGSEEPTSEWLGTPEGR